MGDSPTSNLQSMGKVTAAAGFGNFVDFYEFFISASAAAIVWPTVFFGPLAKSAALATTLSIVTFGVGYITRPLGAFVFGHFGDRSGRNKALALSIFLAFASVLGTGLLPSYASIGLAAVALLFVFRLMLGMALGGEFGGASVWVVEYAEAHGKAKRRGYYGALLGLMQSFGIGLGGLAFTLAEVYSGSAFLSIGWRIPYLAGAVIAIVGLIIRLRMFDSPLFQEILKSRQIAKVPAGEAVRGKLGILMIAAMLMYFFQAANGVFFGGPIAQVYILRLFGHLTNSFGTASTLFAPLTIAVAYFVGAAIGAVVGGPLSDRIGRKKAMVLPLAGTLIFLYPYYLLMGTANGLNILLATNVIEFLVWLAVGITFVWFAEMFPTRLRYSGTGLTAEIGVLGSGIVTSIIVPPLITGYTGISYLLYGGVIPGAIVSALALAVLFALPETKDRVLSKIGVPVSSPKMTEVSGEEPAN
ncbi:MFS transporter [Thermoplasmatales archaeon AK]|nr:MFS transporter [Thermoplasmatales archaeon AK]